jgi:hypothetical protein
MIRSRGEQSPREAARGREAIAKVKNRDAPAVTREAVEDWSK